MLKVLRQLNYQGLPSCYIVSDGEVEETVRIKQLPDFCILRKFENAVYKNGVLEPINDGFEVVKNLTPKHIRIEEMCRIIDLLINNPLNAIGCKRAADCREDPNYLYFNCCGSVVKISSMPGTEYFNNLVWKDFNLKGVELDSCKYIDATHGNVGYFSGLKMKNQLCVDTDYMIEIGSCPYSKPSWCDEEIFKKIQYIITVRGNIDGIACLDEKLRIVTTKLLER